jgi:hypothetical protein
VLAECPQHELGLRRQLDRLAESLGQRGHLLQVMHWRLSPMRPIACAVPQGETPL